MAQSKIRRMVSNHRNEFWGKKCLEIQSYLGSKRALSLGNFLKIYVKHIVVRATLT